MCPSGAARGERARVRARRHAAGCIPQYIKMLGELVLPCCRRQNPTCAVSELVCLSMPRPEPLRRSAPSKRRGSSRAARSVEGAGDTDKALGKPDRSRPMTRATPTPSTGMCALHVCRSPVARALTRMLTCACCASLGRLCYTLKDYGVEFTYPQACLAVLVADQRGQASLAIRVAVNVLPSPTLIPLRMRPPDALHPHPRPPRRPQRRVPAH